MLIELTTSNFDEEVEKADKPVFISFWAAWCGPCNLFHPLMEQLAEKYADTIMVCRVDTEKEGQLASAFEVKKIPTLMIIKNRTIIYCQPGALSMEQLEDLVDQAIRVNIEELNSPKFLTTK
ncbi:thioredoxin [Chitinophaga jiangningensis]|uniref:Thioredoxin n=1 Tax=Chitinophaga jiangningensis TaxID=1419482 RepID=A0A1M7L2Z7_9BACT|nr:thioredoxin domain-containing protein [Chitinophaga jiangningensis]SHM72214.1 thioredoxin [Chitinophaga jiangningensis]